MENVKVILWGLGAMGGGIGKMLCKKQGVDIVGAIDIGAKAIVVSSISGRTVRMVSRFRSPVDILGITTSEKTWRKLALSWGVFPVLARLQSSSDELLLHAIDCAKQIDAVENGDIVVIAAGIPLDTTGSTNLMRVAVVGKR